MPDVRSTVNGQQKAASGWVTATLRWIWAADDDVSLRELFTSTSVTWIVLLIVCAVSCVDFALGGTSSEVGQLTKHLGISPAGVAKGEWWRLVTTALVNPPELDPPSTGIQHLLFNVLGLVFAGPRVERAFGSRRFVSLLFVATVSGAVAIFLGAPFYWEASGGTSGAVYGLFGATLVTAISRRRRSKTDAIFLGAVLVVIINLAIAVPGFPAGTNVSHFGGFIAGAVIAAAWCIRPSARVGTAIAVALLVVAGSLAVVRTADVRSSDLAVKSEVPVGFPPEMLTLGFESIWVTGEEIGQVVRIDARSGRVLARIREDGAGGFPVVTDGRIWVPGRRGVAAIDPGSNRVASRIRLSNDAWAWGLAATKDALWAAVSDRGEVVRIDLRTREQKSIAVGEDTYAVATDGSDVWATSYGSRTVSRLDRTSGKVLAKRRLTTAPYQMAVLDGSVWVGAQPFVYRLDPESLDVIAKIDVEHDIWTLTPDENGLLVVAARFSRELVRLDPATNAVESRVEVGLRQPIAVAFANDTWIVDAFGNSIVRTSTPE